MISFTVLVLTLAIGFVGFIVYTLLQKKTSLNAKIPGPLIVSKKEGNLPDMQKSETFFNYVAEIHDEFGPIVGFHMGEQYVVSIASAELFQEHSALFDRPTVIFKPLEDIVTLSSIQFTNGAEGKRRHASYSKFFSSTTKFYPKFFEFLEENFSKKILESENKEISLQKSMFDLTSATLSKCAFADIFTESELDEFIRLYDEWATDLEQKFRGLEKTASIKNALSPSQKMREIVEIGLSRHKKKDNINESGENFIDIVLTDQNLTEEAKYADVITMLIGGIHTTANLLTWAIYFLAKNEDVQELVIEELDTHLLGGSIEPEDIKKLTYLQQVVDESLRLGSVATFSARVSEESYELGGFTIPSGTPVLHALAHVLQNEDYFQDADSFDPDHFSEENVKNRHPFAFKPFGFAGNRVCPGNKFAVQEVLVSLAFLFSRFEISLAGDQTAEPYYGFVTRPRNEILINVEKRNFNVT